ncbi:divergent polysaccharide deacetylase family protein [Allorhizobium terrae]|uniref:Divergent polysaccharide deacetylase family protein n=1 Tax=Allorhizobium terrae TaxID=1848972 RepID=A0A4S3ZWQ3_9HYPH|nr:divergent polysaccharide deacetylase family protein [Allorhizobium terrae]THF50247.1 divergent polysaccharide deacetylase family protein [Allorhizobium terrae]
MGNDLHAPLGQNRKKPRAKGRNKLGGSGLGPVSVGLVSVLAILGLSFYTALTPLPLTAPLPQVAEAPTKPADTAVAVAKPQTLETRSPTSGAIVERSTMPDGSVVTQYSPASRDGTGPALISASRIGQDARMAAIPNPELLQDSPEGKLPVIGPDGLRPVEQYARPWSGAHGTRIAIVVSGLGLSQTGTQKAIRLLPEEITLGFAASGNSLQRWMQDARRAGHEILLQMPLEPLGYPANNPGRDTLLADQSSAKNLALLHKAMASITNYTGIMNYMGARFLSDANALEPVIRDIADRGLLFLDDGSSAQSLSGKFAKAMNMPYAFADLQLDDQLQRDAILKRLDELERIAKRNGSAIGVASAFDESVSTIAEWVREAKSRGIEIVGVSALALENQE